MALGLAGGAAIAAFGIARGRHAATLSADLTLPTALTWPRLGQGRIVHTFGDSIQPAWLLLKAGDGTTHRICRLEGEGPRLGRLGCWPFHVPGAELRLLRGGKVPIVGSLDQGAFEIREQVAAAIDPALVRQLPRHVYRAKGGGTFVVSNAVIGGDLLSQATNGLAWIRFVEGKEQASGFIEGNFSGGLFEGTYRRDLFTCSSDAGGVAAAWRPQPERILDSQEGGTGTRGRDARYAAVPAPPRAAPESMELAFLHDGTWSKALSGPLPPRRTHEFGLECEDNRAMLTSVVENQLVQLSCSPRGCSSTRVSVTNLGAEPRFIEFRALGTRNVLIYLSRNALLFRMAAFDDLPTAREYRAFALPSEGDTLDALAVRAPNAVYVLFGRDNEWRGLAIDQNGQVVPITLDEG